MADSAASVPSQDVELMVRFFPELLSLMMDASLHAACRQLKEDHTPYTPSQHFVTSLANNPCAMHVSCTYALHLLQKHDLRTLGLLLPAVGRGYTRSDSAQLPDVFLHLFVLNLTSQSEPVREATLQPILRDFWLPCSRHSEPALLHFCRLLWTLHPYINRSTLEEVLEGMRPGEQVCGGWGWVGVGGMRPGEQVCGGWGWVGVGGMRPGEQVCVCGCGGVGVWGGGCADYLPVPHLSLYGSVALSTAPGTLLGLLSPTQLSAVAREQYQTLVEHIAASSQSD